jgi:hypothetical protein
LYKKGNPQIPNKTLVRHIMPMPLAWLRHSRNFPFEISPSASHDSASSMVIVVVERKENTNQLNYCCKDHQNMENLMGASEYIESAWLE